MMMMFLRPSRDPKGSSTMNDDVTVEVPALSVKVAVMVCVPGWQLE